MDGITEGIAVGQADGAREGTDEGAYVGDVGRMDGRADGVADSIAYRYPSSDATKIRPSEPIAGDDTTLPPVTYVHRRLPLLVTQ